MATENPPLAELFWGAYLTAEFNAGNIADDTDVAAMKEEFMAGIRGERADASDE